MCFSGHLHPSLKPHPLPALRRCVRGAAPAHLRVGPYLGGYEARPARGLPGSHRERLPTRRKVGKGVSAHSEYVLRVVWGRQGLKAGPVLNAGRLFEDGRGLAGRKLLDAAPRSRLGFATIPSCRFSPTCRPRGTGDAQRKRRPPALGLPRSGLSGRLGPRETEGALKLPGGALKTFREP